MANLAPDWKNFPKHWSTWLGVATIVADSAYVFIDAASASMSPQTVIMLNAAAAVGMKILNLLKQDIPITPEVKSELIEAAKERPTTYHSGGVANGPSVFYPGHVPPQPMPAPAVVPTVAPVTMREYIDKTVAAKVAEALAAKSRAGRSKKPRSASLPATEGGDA